MNITLAHPHPWNVTVEEAKQIQADMARLVRIEPLTMTPRTVAGIDVSVMDGGDGFVARAAVVVLDYESLRPIAQATTMRPVTFPYVPGLLAFREIPAVIKTLEKLDELPDLLVCDAQGLSHPRLFGLACQMGVMLERPAIGCAKSKLVGDYQEPGPQPGDRSVLTFRGRTVGMVLRSKARSNPLFISVGHRVTLDNALDAILHCLKGYRLPEPTRLAHEVSRGAQVVQSPAAKPDHSPGGQLSLF